MRGLLRWLGRGFRRLLIVGDPFAFGVRLSRLCAPSVVAPGATFFFLPSIRSSAHTPLSTPLLLVIRKSSTTPCLRQQPPPLLDIIVPHYNPRLRSFCAYHIILPRPVPILPHIQLNPMQSYIHGLICHVCILITILLFSSLPLPTYSQSQTYPSILSHLLGLLASLHIL